jgi:hypothetical protein
MKTTVKRVWIRIVEGVLFLGGLTTGLWMILSVVAVILALWKVIHVVAALVR